jgi:transposase
VLSKDQLFSLPAPLRESVEAVLDFATRAEQRAERAELEAKYLRELLRLERIKKYGPASEPLSDAQLALLEEEPGVHPQEVQLEAELPEPQKQVDRPNKARRGEQSLPADLPREEVLIACTAAECECPSCHGQREVIGHETTERLHRIPARYVVKVFKREKRACRRCEEAGVATAARPAFIISKGIATNETVVDVVLSKYELHLPLYRQEAQLAREGEVLLSRSTLCDWVMQCGFLLQAVVREMQRDLLAGGYIQADETPIGVQSAEVRGRNHRGYLWQYGHPQGSVIFDYQDGRGRDGPARMLRGFRGKLQSDGYSVYGQLKLDGTLHFACMAHVRRKFHEAAKVDPDDAALVKILGAIAQLYAIEERARKDQLTCEERTVLRQSESRPILEHLKELILSKRQQVLPKSLAGRACEYAFGQWKKLERYLDHGEVEIDNNHAERSIKPVAIGRKNWLHFGSKQAGPNIAAILSVIETCHRLKISARNYLLEVLPRLANGSQREVPSLTPKAWAAARQP